MCTLYVEIIHLPIYIIACMYIMTYYISFQNYFGRHFQMNSRPESVRRIGAAHHGRRCGSGRSTCATSWETDRSDNLPNGSIFLLCLHLRRQFILGWSLSVAFWLGFGLVAFPWPQIGRGNRDVDIINDLTNYTSDAKTIPSERTVANCRACTGRSVLRAPGCGRTIIWHQRIHSVFLPAEEYFI